MPIAPAAASAVRRVMVCSVIAMTLAPYALTRCIDVASNRVAKRSRRQRASGAKMLEPERLVDDPGGNGRGDCSLTLFVASLHPLIDAAVIGRGRSSSRRRP